MFGNNSTHFVLWLGIPLTIMILGIIVGFVAFLYLHLKNKKIISSTGGIVVPNNYSLIRLALIMFAVLLGITLFSLIYQPIHFAKKYDANFNGYVITEKQADKMGYSDALE